MREHGGVRNRQMGNGVRSLLGLHDPGVRIQCHRSVQITVVGITGKVVRFVVRAVLVIVGVSGVRGVKREVAVVIDVEHHATVQAETADRKHGEADNEGGKGAG